MIIFASGIINTSKIEDWKKVDPFQFLKIPSITDNEMIRGMFSSMAGLITLVGIAGVILSSMVYIISAMVFKRKPEQMAEFKQVLGGKIAIVFFLSIITTIFAFAKYIGEYMIS